MKINIKKTIPWIILVLITASFFAWYLLSSRVTKETLDSYSKKISEATLSLEGKEYSTALSKYYEAAILVPGKVEAYKGIVTILLTKNRTKDAIDIVEKTGSKLSQVDKESLYKLIGDRYYSNGQYNEAKSMFEKSNSNLELGRAYLKLNDLDNAKKMFEKDGYSGENLDEARLLVSYIDSTSDIELGKNDLKGIQPTDKWKPYYEEFSEVLNSLSEDTKYNAAKLSRVYINNGYPYLAIKLLEPIANDISEYVEGLYFLGRAYEDVKEYDKAVTVLDRALSVGSLESEICLAKARALLEKNDLEGAESSYVRAISYKKSESLMSEYFDVLLNNEQALAAKELHKNNIEKIKEPYMYIYGVKIYYILKDSEKYGYYLDLLSKATLNESQKNEYLSILAEIKIASNERVAADSALQELLKLDKYNPKYYYLLAQYKEMEGDKQGAKDSLEKALEYDLNYSITEQASKMLSRLN